MSRSYEVKTSLRACLLLRELTAAYHDGCRENYYHYAGVLLIRICWLYNTIIASLRSESQLWSNSKLSLIYTDLSSLLSSAQASASADMLTLCTILPVDLRAIANKGDHMLHYTARGARRWSTWYPLSQRHRLARSVCTAVIVILLLRG